MSKANVFLRKHIWIILIVLIALFVRVYNLPSLTTFSGEEGKDFLIVRKIVTEKNVTLLGPMIGPYNNVSQVFLGPAYYYLILTPLLVFNFNPIGPAYFIAICSVLSASFVYMLCKKLFKIEIALFSAAIFAFTPVLVEQGRSSNPAYFIPIFSAVLFFAITKVIIEKKHVYLALMGVSLGLLIQFHLTTISAILGTILAFLIFRPKVSLRGYLLLVASFLVTIFPILLFEVRNKFFISNSILAQINHSRNFKSSTQNILEAAARSLAKLFDLILFHSNLALIIICTLLIALSFITISKNELKKDSKILMFLASWVVINVIIVAVYSGPFVPHYFASSFIPIIIIVTYLLFNTKWKTVGLFALSLIVALNLFSNDITRNHGYSMPEGWNLKGVEKASNIISQDIDISKQFNVAATLDGDIRARPYRYFLDLENKKPLDVESYPNAEVLYLISKDTPTEIKNYSVWEVSSFMPFAVSLLGHVQNGVSVYKLVKEPT